MRIEIPVTELSFR